MKRLRAVLFSSVIALSTLGIAGPALAYPAVSNMYSGTACRFTGAQGTDTHFNPSGYGANGLKNTSTSVRYAVCPITRDYMQASSLAYISTYITYADVVVADGTTCELLAQPWTGAWSTIYPPDHSHNPHGTTMVYSYGYQSNWVGLGAYTVAALYCRVPAGGTIMNYIVTESHDPS